MFDGWTPNVSANVEGNVIYTAKWALDLNNNGIADNRETSIGISPIIIAALAVTVGLLSVALIVVSRKKKSKD